MKKINKLFTLIILTSLTFSAGAQINIGIKVGGNLSNIHQNFKNSDLETASKMIVGFHLGLNTDIPLNEMFSFQPALLFTTKGSIADMKEQIEIDVEPFPIIYIDGISHTTLNYIEIPLNFAFKANDLQIFAGPYLAMGFGGLRKQEYTVSYSISSWDPIDYRQEIKLKPVFGEVKENDLGRNEDAYTALDYGLNFGLGYMVGPMLIQGGYSLGLGNITPKYEDNTKLHPSEYKKSNRVITLSISYLFEI